jgi:hypothetical protein
MHPCFPLIVLIVFIVFSNTLLFFLTSFRIWVISVNSINMYLLLW